MNSPSLPPAIRTRDPRVEVAWFSALCGDDYEYLGVPDGALRSNYEHCGDIVRKADALGFQNILLPSGWIVGQDALAFAAAMAPQTTQINQLVALRMGEVWPPMLARALATVDHIAQGRLCINIISSDMPGLKESNEVRYERSSEIIQILQKLWATDGPLEWKGEYYNFTLPNCEAAKPYQQNGGPLMYFGGISPAAQDLCAKHCDVFLMWPETEERIAETMRGMAEKAAAYGRTIDFGFRAHVVVRETESEASGTCLVPGKVKSHQISSEQIVTLFLMQISARRRFSSSLNSRPTGLWGWQCRNKDVRGVMAFSKASKSIS